MSYRIFPVLLLLCLCLSCKKEVKREISFYYWKTRFELNSDQKKALKEFNVRKLYIRYFDLDISGNTIHPVEPVVFLEKPVVETIIPVVYIKNRIFLSDGMNMDSLAIKTLKYISVINNKNGILCHEIQLDCDWTQKTKASYFAYITALKKKTKLSISATIRLHQVRFAQKTGVPDVDYGVLMYYNMGSISSDGLNSIYDQKTALPYLKNIALYPKKLKVALPVFQWYVHIRNKQVLQLYAAFETQDFNNTDQFRISNNNIFVIQPVFVKGVYFEKNDILKLECIEPGELKEMISDLEAKNLNFSEIILFDLSSKNLKSLHHEIL